jgi:hypothetical protein
VNSSPQRIIFIIRHGEKPGQAVPGADACDPPGPHGIDYCGNQNDANCLTPRGWSRAGALVSFFAPYDGHFRPGITAPSQLISPGYPKKAPDLATTQQHRTYQTIWQLSDELSVNIDYTDYHEGEESDMGAALAAIPTGVTLVCWEHTAIPAIAKGIQPNADFPAWPDDRFDVVWSFARDGTDYDFTQIGQMLLRGDSEQPITGPTPAIAQ